VSLDSRSPIPSHPIPLPNPTPKQEDTLGAFVDIYRAADAEPLLLVSLCLVAVTSVLNLERSAALSRDYGAATAGVLSSLEILFAWGMALLIGWISDAVGARAFGTLGPNPLPHSSLCLQAGPRRRLSGLARRPPEAGRVGDQASRFMLEGSPEPAEVEAPRCK
jgi:hypothetical protein